MKLPPGQLRRRRVVTDLSTPLANALEAELTGYMRLESQDALLLDGDGVGVLTFEDGIPVLAYHTGTDNGGAAALADIAVAGPHRMELYELDRHVLTEVHEAADLRVPPGLPAERLAGNSRLGERTRKRAPGDRRHERSEGANELDAVEAFLDDEETIETLRERASEEATLRADEWGFEVE